MPSTGSIWFQRPAALLLLAEWDNDMSQGVLLIKCALRVRVGVPYREIVGSETDLRTLYASINGYLVKIRCKPLSRGMFNFKYTVFQLECWKQAQYSLLALKIGE